ncbi:MAG TPA: hypothetical protein GXX75_12120 [Clostridiales bacterium]|nr:hypothetical protein [Clostridiales bacterium]
MFTKKVIKELENCYSIAPLTYRGKNCILVAAEKHAPCYLFTDDGELIDTVWEEPGGVMTMVQLPGKDGEFLATHQFYSPNDSKEAKIVYVRHDDKKGWVVTELVKLPFIHRFDIITRNGVNYLLACALKSGYEYKEDWRFPGQTFTAILPEDLSQFHEGNNLRLTLIKDKMLRNHGYTRYFDNGIQTGIISCDNGVYQFIPPVCKTSDWQVKELINEPTSDALLGDFDGDGNDELFVITPFHGNFVKLYKRVGGSFKEIYQIPLELEMLHAIYQGTIHGRHTIIFGHRKGNCDLLQFYYDHKEGGYKYEVIDHGRGPANVYMYHAGGQDKIVATNRETNEIAIYTYCKEDGK